MTAMVIVPAVELPWLQPMAARMTRSTAHLRVHVVFIQEAPPDSRTPARCPTGLELARPLSTPPAHRPLAPSSRRSSPQEYRPASRTRPSTASARKPRGRDPD